MSVQTHILHTFSKYLNRETNPSKPHLQQQHLSTNTDGAGASTQHASARAPLQHGQFTALHMETNIHTHIHTSVSLESVTKTVRAGTQTLDLRAVRYVTSEMTCFNNLTVHSTNEPPCSLLDVSVVSKHRLRHTYSTCQCCPTSGPNKGPVH